MFCTNCGKQLADGSRFCTNCGKQLGVSAPVQQAPQQPVYNAPPPQPQYQQQFQNAGEQVHLVISTNRKYSMLKMTPCNIVFMSDRLVLAHLSKERQKMESDRLSQEIKASGKGFFKGSAAMMSYWSNYHKKYYEMNSGQILAEDPDNMLIYYNTITQLLFHAYDTDYSSDGSQQTSGGKPHISLAGGETLKFSHSIGNNSSIRDTLTQLLGSRLKYKR